VIRDLRSSNRMPGVERVRLPGEGSHATFLDRSRAGVPLNDALLGELARLAADLGIAPLG
jgi:LDH2 family malate/lactate/ureidoglycolate dehydrogenase